MLDIENIIKDKNKEIKDEYKGCLSVSALCNEYIRVKFDDVGQAQRCEAKGQTDPNYKYAGMTAEEILNKWKENANKTKEYGKQLDLYADMRLNHRDEELELWKLDFGFDYEPVLQSLCKGFDDFYNMLSNKTNYRYIARELPLYCKSSKGNMINGRFDCMFYDEVTGGIIIIDWKTTEGITTESKYNKHLLGPAYMLDDCDMNLYTIQLHIYKKALVETYGISSFDKISVYVCNVFKQPDEQGNYYKLFKQNFPFDTNKLDSFIDFGTNKKKLLNVAKTETFNK